MTTIAYKDGVLAADSMMTGGSVPFRFATVDKIAHCNDRAVIGAAAGHYRAYPTFLEWIKDGAVGNAPQVEEEAEGVLIRACAGKAPEIWLWSGGQTLIRLPDDAFVALGSGERFALGAMYAGADAIDAVRCGIFYDSASGGAVNHIKIGELNHA